MRREKPRAERAAKPEQAKFEETLGKLIQLANGSLSDSNAQPRAVDGRRDQPGATEPSPQSRLRRKLEDLEPEAALKIRTLMIAGRDVRDVAAVRLDTTLGESETAFTTAARDASENGPLLADYLQRGHALACAAALDLEAPLASWASDQAGTLDERAWRSFGRQLASSEPEDWQFVGCLEPGSKEIVRLYVKLQEHAWWSFQSLLDRPSGASVNKETRALTSRRTKGLIASSLKTLAPRLAIAPAGADRSAAVPGSRKSALQGRALQGRALRRAARAIRARVGENP